MIKRVAVLVMIVFTMAILSGCNTFHGFGKDLEDLGRVMQGEK